MSAATPKLVPPALTQIIQEGRLTISPELAVRIINETLYERQRLIKPFRLHRHVVTIQRGQWDNDFPIRFMRLDGHLILVDGQHRLHAIVNTGITVGLIVTITPARTVADVHAAYSRIDSDGNRSLADVLNAADPTAGRSIGFELRRAGYKAMDALANDFPHKKLKVGESELVTREDRIACMGYWLDELETYNGIIEESQGPLRSRMRNSGVVAVALATLKHQSQRAAIFWRNVGENRLLQPGDPEQAMVNFLLSALLVRGNNLGQRGAAMAWNSWFHGRRLGAVKRDAERSTRPIFIAGTPFNGRPE